ncbi:hypothetical protein HXX76_014342 [Chlamydomonas incerta]|uniref:BPL/LPL catalytic domain-containing protein n=1 Tax=Chlamydomonas incerta TaxID=51695 RepID=A0A835VPQ3_CHLIN|nr:hypothetical protein HXX76_014342 [Chlamydomonas incerta]|eukprot:KAG2424617.1 hypothetical protein HXX76_014342 [Chlamydomonas incerta]
MQGSALPHVEAFPQPIMKWTEELYRPAFAAAGCKDFSLRENDYVVAGGRKVGGNAQAITGKRWLHHTSFLWDYDPAHMALLRHPPKAPKYREGRGHGDFVTRLCEVLHPEHGRRRLVENFGVAAAELGFAVQERTLADAAPALSHRPLLLGTKLLDLREFLQ